MWVPLTFLKSLPPEKFQVLFWREIQRASLIRSSCISCEVEYPYSGRINVELLLLDPPSISVDEKLNLSSLGGREREIYLKGRVSSIPFLEEDSAIVLLSLFKHRNELERGAETLENSTKPKNIIDTAVLPTREFSIRRVKNQTKQTYRLHRVPHRFSPPTLHPHRLPFTDGYRNFAYAMRPWLCTNSRQFLFRTSPSFFLHALLDRTSPFSSIRTHHFRPIPLLRSRGERFETLSTERATLP